MKQRRIAAPDMPLAPFNAQPGTTQPPSPALTALQPANVQPARQIEVPAEIGSDLEVGGEWQIIPLSKLKIHPFNSRALRTQERIEEVRDMLESEHKQREPITVVPGRKPEDLGHFFILSGQTRYHAANLAGWVGLKSQINSDIDPDDHLAFFRASIEHNTARPETDWDLAVKVRALVDEGVESSRIQAAIRRDERSIRRLMAMTELPETLVSVVKDNPAKLTAAVCEILKSAVSKLGEEPTVTIAREAVENDMSRRALQDRVERAIRRGGRQNGAGKRAIREFMLPIVVGPGKKAGEFKVMQSRNQGNRVIALNADLPADLVESFKTDIEAAIAKLPGRGDGA